MEEIDTILCPKKICMMQKHQHDFFFSLFFLHCVKLEKTLTFGEEFIDINKFHIYKKPISIDGLDTKKLCYLVKNHTVINTSLDVIIIMMVLYHYT